MSGQAGGSTRYLGVLCARPSVPVCVALILGIALHRQFPPIQSWHLLIPLSAVLVALMLRRHNAISSLLLLLAMSGAGVLLGQLDRYRYEPSHISQFTTDAARLAQLELRVDDQPRVMGSLGQFRRLPPKQTLTASVMRLRGWEGWIDVNGKIAVTLDQPHPRLAVGQRIIAFGMLQRPGPAMNPGQFDWEAYYRDQRICASFRIPQIDNVEIVDSQFPGPITRLRQFARNLLGEGFLSHQSLNHALLRALLLGDNDPELRDIQEDFRRSGTSHHLAISGAHIAVLGGFIYLCCRFLQIQPRTTTWLTLIFIILYGVVALPSPPVVRSVLLCSSVALGLLGHRRGDMLHLLALSAIAMLVYHPMDLYNAGFQLSYGTVLGMILLNGPVERWFHNIDDEVISYQKNFRGRMARWKIKVRTVLITGAVAWLISLPLIAFHFEQINPWAIGAGIALAPVVVIALLGGLGKIVATLLFPSLAGTWAKIAAQPMNWMGWMVQKLAELPGGDIPLPSPPLWVLLAYYAMIGLAFVPFASQVWQKRARWSPVLGVLLILIFPLRDGVARTRSLVRGFEITLLSVGAGQCLVVEPPNSPASIIDCGSSSLGEDLLRKCIAPFLRHQGRREIDRVILTHSDYDHISSTAETVQMYDVRQVLIGPHLRSQAQTNGPALQLLEELDSLDRTPAILSIGQKIDLGGGAGLEVLWPPLKGDFTTNNGALVLKITYAGKSILLPADIQDQTMLALLDHPQKLKSEILLAPHHGSAENATADFVNAINPQIVIASNDRTLSHKQILFNKLVSRRQFLRTSESGAIHITISPRGQISVDPFRPQPQR